MFLCFFSLSASMTTNILEQSKEIAVLRAMGFSKGRLVFLYIYEAFVVVLSASFLGILIGVIVGWTMTMQRSLFTDIPLQFFFPTLQFLVILGVSIVCAVLAVLTPSRAIVGKQIAQIFRLN